jgi:hypothetical protein
VLPGKKALLDKRVEPDKKALLDKRVDPDKRVEPECEIITYNHIIRFMLYKNIIEKI